MNGFFPEGRRVISLREREKDRPSSILSEDEEKGGEE